MIFLNDISTTVSFAVPTTRKTEAETLTLTLTHEVTMSETEVSLPSSAIEIGETKVMVTTSLPSTLHTGQYKYNLSDTEGTLSEGLLQIGDTTPSITEYSTSKQRHVYEG